MMLLALLDPPIRGRGVFTHASTVYTPTTIRRRGLPGELRNRSGRPPSPDGLSLRHDVPHVVCRYLERLALNSLSSSNA